MSSFAFTSTKWAIRLASTLTKADMRMHNIDVIEDDMSIMFVVNHFTRIETILLPYQLNQHLGKEVWSLAAAELFSGRIGGYLRKVGTVSTEDPDRDKVIVHSLLKADHPWIIFPEGQMIKDKKVLDPAGMFSVYDRGGRRPPHRGAAILALRAEFYRYKIECIFNSPAQQGLDEIRAMFDLDSVEDILRKRTVIVPINITYFPIRSRDNIILRMASALTKDLSDRALDELSVEGTLLSSDTDIDITLGEPIDVRSYLHEPEYAELMACGDDLRKVEMDPASLFNEASGKLMFEYMGDIYRLTRINYDHIFATIVRYQGAVPFTERRYRNRIFLCVRELMKNEKHRFHTLLEKTYRDIIYEDPSPKFHDFMTLCLREKILTFDGTLYHKTENPDRGKADFHAIRSLETTFVIANEVEPLEGFADTVRKIAQATRKKLSKEIRDIFLEEDIALFESDYAEYKADDSHGMEVGRPFLLVPERYKAGIVLVHGYMAAPLEVRALANYLYEKGYVVYGVRLRGHGTSPEDLAQTVWKDWYESVNRGYVIVKTLTDRIVLGGFSTGGCLALMGAGLKGPKIQAAFSINAPLKLRQFTAKLAPSVVSMTGLLKKIKGSPTGWEYVQNSPENEHINYSRNPLTGIRELGYAMAAMEDCLTHIRVPTLVIQGSKDPVVDPSSGPDIFEKVGTPLKELTVFERDNHGIVNGDGAQDVFDRVFRFLLWAHDKKPTEVRVDEEIGEAEPIAPTVEATSEAT
ncbi:MAG: alpha/beta fold hydrolase [Candidatus Hydrogenedentes bacterium]|nr:alpha/beta fold hydrolase [Candidatus Hydrogenedentota bacterium]